MWAAPIRKGFGRLLPASILLFQSSHSHPSPTFSRLRGLPFHHLLLSCSHRNFSFLAFAPVLPTFHHVSRLRYSEIQQCQGQETHLSSFQRLEGWTWHPLRVRRGACLLEGATEVRVLTYSSPGAVLTHCFVRTLRNAVKKLVRDL